MGLSGGEPCWLQHYKGANSAMGQHDCPAVRKRPCSYLRLPPPSLQSPLSPMEGPEKACSMSARQKILPLRVWGLGLRMQSDGVLDAEALTGPVQAYHRLKGHPGALYPLPGDGGPMVSERWRNLHEWCAEMCKRGAAAMEPPTELLKCRKVLPGAPHAKIVTRKGND